MKKNNEDDKKSDSIIVEKMMRDALLEFNEKSRILTDAYTNLKNEVARINIELEKKNQELLLKNTALDEAKEFLNNLFQSMSGCLIVLDKNNTIVKVNSAFLSLFKASEKDFIYKNLESIDYFEPINKFVNTSRKTNSSHNNSACTINFKNDILWLELTGSMVKGGQEFLLLMKDLTEVKDLRKQLLQNAALKDLGQMAVTVAHEIRNPLGGIEGFASLLKRDLVGNESHLKLIEKIIQGVRNLNSFIGCLLTFAKPLQFSPKKINPSESVIKAIHYSGKDDELDKYPNIKIIKDIINTEIISDPFLIQQLVLNLLLNSYQVINENNGIVHIKVANNSSFVDKELKILKIIKSLNFDESKNFCVISIKDSGCGIDEIQIEKIFKPFYTTKSFGTGVGLSMVYKIIEVLEGKIEVIGKSDLGGAEFIVYIPNLNLSLN